MPDTWHNARDAFQSGCIHCEDSYPGSTSSHYLCVDGAPCQDCADEMLTQQENIDAGYGPWGEDTGSDVAYDW